MDAAGHAGEKRRGICRKSLHRSEAGWAWGAGAGQGTAEAAGIIFGRRVRVIQNAWGNLGKPRFVQA
jgi:hypothetical protein